MKKYKKEIFVTIGIFVIFFAVWVFGASSLFIEMSFLPDFWLRVFRDISNLENVFSPVAAFFGGLSAFGTTILIYLQIKLNKKQEQDVRRNIFENQIGQMFLIKNEIIKSLSVEPLPGEIYKDRHVFEFLYECAYYLLFHYLEEDKLKKQENSFGKTEKNKAIESVLSPANDGDGQLYNDHKGGKVTVKRMSVNSILKLIENKLNREFKYMLSPFYHNVYATLKMINSNTEISDIERSNYMRMLRSQFTQHEFLLIFFHALAYDEKKFKQLIEDTCFFHSLVQDYIPIKDLIYEKIDAKKENFGYSYRAFFHSKAEYSEYLKRQKESEDNQSQNR